VIDPISGLVPGGSEHDVRTLVLRIVDTLKQSGATGLFTSLSVEDDLQSTTLSISSLVDAWIPVAPPRGKWRAQPLAVCFEITRHGALASDPRILHDLEGRPLARGVHRSRRSSYRVHPASPGKPKSSARSSGSSARASQRELAVKAALRLLDAKISALQAEKVAQENELAMVIGEGEGP
jgi:hypothetical protein